MTPDSLEFLPRRRDPWEALDLGVLLARRCWRTLLASWLLVTVPVLILLIVFLDSLESWACVILWWLKPWFERPMVMALSRRVFGERFRLRSGLRLLIGSIQLSLLWHLSLGRLLELARSLVLPVLLLERQRGTARWARIRAVKLGQLSIAQLLTLICFLFEAIFFLALFVLGLMLLPAPIGLDWQSVLDWVVEQGVVPLLMVYISTSLVTPVYVCSGFALYLNRRSELEGWDLQVSLASLQERLIRRQSDVRGRKDVGSARARGSSTQILAGVVVAAALAVGGAGEVRAERSSSQADSTPLSVNLHPAAKSREVIDKVYQLDELQDRAQETQWFRWDEDEEPSNSPDWTPQPSFIDDIAQLIEIAIWCVGIIGLLYLLYHFRHRLRMPVWPREGEKSTLPRTVLDVSLAQELAPFEFDSIRSLLERREYRAALSSMYRESCRLLALSAARQVAPGTTEKQLLHAAREWAPTAVADAVTELTLVWQLVAYAHRNPDPLEAMSLFERWQAAVSQLAELADASSLGGEGAG